MYISRHALAPLLLGAVLTSASISSAPAAHDPLPSWRKGPAKQAILDFVGGVIDESSVSFVPAPERVAVFDNDGTLWCERPVYPQLAFMVDRAEAYIEQEPELAAQEPYKSLVEGMLDPHDDLDGFLRLAAESHAGMLQSEFTGVVKAWLVLGRHPRFGRGYDDLVYLPMLELLAYLRESGFQVWISTGGGQDFVRCFAHTTYGVGPENVIGTTVQKRVEELDGELVLVREPEIVLPVNDGPGKVVNIERLIGRIPILTVGNSDGDVEMMRRTGDGHGPSLVLLVRHDDATRELTDTARAVTDSTAARSAGTVARGTAIGALAGGSRGARRGARVGAGAAILTRGNSLNVPAGTLLEFSLTQPLTR